ncbi:MAG: ABC transporter ATP-binding protein [Pseudonocardiales bacterium]|nr:MAG: ABC transporter ATP-binding protein [Pseudonocardiales bacterium]
MTTTPTIEARGIVRSFGRTRALAGASLVAERGVTGLLGPNGAGKTTLLRMLATVLAPDSGELRLLGRDPGDPRQRLEIRRQLGYLPQEAGYQRGFTPFDFVDYIAILKEFTERRARHDEVRRVLGLVGLDEVRGKRIRALSGGMRRRVGLAQAMLGDPDLLVLDEPTVGLDPEQRLRFRDLISEAGQGRTVILSTHLTDDVAAICGQVVVITEGRTLFSGSPSELVGLAVGHVWAGTQRGQGAVVAWRAEDGRYRNIGQAPHGADLVAPSLEDAYLFLVGSPATPAAA